MGTVNMKPGLQPGYVNPWQQMANQNAAAKGGPGTAPQSGSPYQPVANGGHPQFWSPQQGGGGGVPGMIKPGSPPDTPGAAPPAMNPNLGAGFAQQPQMGAGQGGPLGYNFNQSFPYVQNASMGYGSPYGSFGYGAMPPWAGQYQGK